MEKYGIARHATDDNLMRRGKRFNFNAGWIKQDTNTRS